MAEKQKHSDEDLDLRVSSKLSADLSALFKSDASVPPEVDRAVMDRAYRQLVRRHWRHRLLRWAAPAAAAAAVIIFVFLLELPKTKRSALTVTRSDLVAAQADIDLNGRVDILDAFKLARRIESAGRLEMKWDINGDGKVNRSDVDYVALAAVRLDEGVL